jgi:hypothetical protein
MGSREGCTCFPWPSDGQKTLGRLPTVRMDLPNHSAGRIEALGSKAELCGSCFRRTSHLGLERAYPIAVSFGGRDRADPNQTRHILAWRRWGESCLAVNDEVAYVLQFTGEPLFEDWIYTGELQFILSGNMISINPEYGLMPQSDSNAMRGNRSALLTWMFCHLQKELSKINKNITIDWSICHLFGGSFGGLMAIETWLEHEMHPYKPEQFCIRRIFVRDPMTHVYESNAQEFMGAPIDLAKALSDSDKMIGAFRSSPWTRPRGGTSPPYWMYCSVLLSKLRRWGEFFNGLCPYDNIKATKRCPDERTEWLVTHGDADMHVKVEDTIRMVELLKAQWPNMKVKLDIRCGKGHCSDYAEPLSEEQRHFLDAGA